MKIVRLLFAMIPLSMTACDATPPQGTEGAMQEDTAPPPVAAAPTTAASARRVAAIGESCGGFAGIACGTGLYCEMESGRCNVADDAGVCKPRPEVCTLQYAPVCGCDGKTYGNACEAAKAEAKVSKAGEC